MCGVAAFLASRMRVEGKVSAVANPSSTVTAVIHLTAQQAGLLKAELRLVHDPGIAQLGEVT